MALQARLPMLHPCYRSVQEAGVKTSPIDQKIDPVLLYFTDSSFQDCDELRSAGYCYLGSYTQGGLIDPNSTVPLPFAMSTGEAENNMLLPSYYEFPTFDYDYHGAPPFHCSVSRRKSGHQCHVCQST